MKRTLLTLASVTLALTLPAQVRTPRQPIGTAHTYKTVDGRDLHIYTASPDAAQFPGVRPVLISVHGGGFTGGDPASLNPQAAWFLKRGIASAEVEYPLMRKGGGGAVTLEDQIRDVRSAVRWVKAHAAELNIDPKRTILMGGSAGGYLIEATILLDGPNDPADDLHISTVPVAAVLFNPALDADDGPGMARLLGVNAQQLSPLRHVSQTQPPTIIQSGQDDTTVGIKDVAALQRDLKAIGIPCELFLYPGQVHAFFNHQPYTTATLLAADQFLTALHLTSGPAPSIPNPLPPDKLPLITR